MQELDHIQFLKHVLSKTYDESTASEITACLRPSTIKQYEIHWKSFQRFLHNKHIRIIDKNSVMKYLIFLFKIKKLSPKTILVHRNAISEPVRLAFNISTEDREFRMLSKNFFLKRPPPRHFMPNWSLQHVISFLKTRRFRAKNVTLLDRLKKTLFLVSLATGNRVSELAAMRRHGLAFSNDYRKVTIPVAQNFLYKNQSQDNAPPNIVIRALGPTEKPHLLCPVNNLRKYLAKTKKRRIKSGSLC